MTGSRKAAAAQLPLAGVMVGQHSADMVERFGAALHETWGSLHRLGRNSQISREGQARIHQVLGAMSEMWTLLQVLSKTRLENAAEARQDLLEFLGAPGVRGRLCERACVLVSLMASRYGALRRLQDEKAARTKLGCEYAGNVLNKHFWALVKSGVLAEIPNTAKPVPLPKGVLNQYCEQLCRVWALTTKLCETEDEAVHPLIGRVTGLSMFDAIRAQNQKRIGEGVDELVSWHRRGHIRTMRGHLAVLGLGIHEIAAIADEIAALHKTAGSAAKKRSLKRSERELRNCVYRILMTGILSTCAI